MYMGVHGHVCHTHGTERRMDGWPCVCTLYLFTTERMLWFVLFARCGRAVWPSSALRPSFGTALHRPHRRRAQLPSVRACRPGATVHGQPPSQASLTKALALLLCSATCSHMAAALQRPTRNGQPRGRRSVDANAARAPHMQPVHADAPACMSLHACRLQTHGHRPAAQLADTRTRVGVQLRAQTGA